MLARHFDPDRREMMVVTPTVPSGEAPSAEAASPQQCKSSLVYFFYFLRARKGKHDHRSYCHKILDFDHIM